MKYDIVIIGSGPAGYHAAIIAAQNGLKIAIVESNDIGGTCANWGCIPTKSLLHIAHQYQFIKNHAKKFGINVEKTSISFSEVMQKSRDAATRLSGGVKFLLSSYKEITVFQNSTATLKNSTAVIVKTNDKTQELDTKYVIIATGATPRSIPNITVDHQKIWNYKDALSAKTLPKNLLIVGSGAIGMEFADIYSSLGTSVHIVENQKNILPSMDHTISQFMEKILTKKIKIYTNTNCDIDVNNMSVTLSSASNKKTSISNIDNILIAIGVTPNISNLGLENTKINTNTQGFIMTNSHCQTDEKNIYAIGDVRGNPCLAHKGNHEAHISIHHIMNHVTSSPSPLIPLCIYTNPQVASIGLTEEQAQEIHKDNIKIGISDASSNGKLTSIQESNGLIKLIIHKSTGEILGCHMLGTSVTEIIQSVNIFHNMEATVHEIQNMIFAHPTESEMLYEAALSIDKKAINQIN
ncbi:MAG: dihydrolipoyl dehydrogenase [Candidatus Xenolissoclinum pacificiensis L6]|uniref:Dihydrolipoyl dehydrogenase n=1 Tax=Candidatus Xenolissoclinum pacificiensis L6 TaxID=1401685 RepID=W2UZ04_9RICK|nr:MAG: dihydrolipoyl dehydrogenase [Candidatus Xenolissoclinum pacificiensis L6]